MDDPILRDLNPGQHDAVVHGEGPLMVLAGAGSGKTRVVTRRIAWLLQQGIQPSQILGMTFTNKAAGEMARRVAEFGGGWVRLATFHSACARFLRQDGERLGYPRDFSIYDTQDRDALLKRMMQDMGLLGGRVKPSHLGRHISKLKNLAVRPDDYVPGRSELHDITARVYGPYETRMRELGSMDFDDLMLRFGDLLRQFPDVAEDYTRRFPWVLVDEFQDTNRVQYDLLTQLVPKEGNLCVVGDPDQSIYGFRGADVRNILDFQEDRPGTVVVRLEQNYRSTRTILNAAEEVIRNNTQRLDKRLRTENDEGDPLVLHVAENPSLEAREICEQIQRLVQDGVSLNEIAVFYRSHFLSRTLEEAMRNRGVPYVLVGGVSFFERREIKDLLAYLKVVANPLDDVSMERVINVPPRGIGKVTLDKIRAAAFAEGMSLYEAVREPEIRQKLANKPRKALDELAAVFDEVAKVSATSAHEALKAICDGTGYIDYACGVGDPDDSTREENIAELLSDVASFDAETGGGLGAYLAHVSLQTSMDRSAEGGEALSMLTIHAAKGLEYDHVFVSGLEDGVFPSSRSADDPDALEEERRLMYVALTRARRTLHLSQCRTRMVNGQFERQEGSRFLDELPGGAVEKGGDEGGWSSWDSVVEEDAWVDQQEVIQVQPGARVRHPEYGSGVVEGVSGMGI